jgi:hypothetical protein
VCVCVCVCVCVYVHLSRILFETIYACLSLTWHVQRQFYGTPNPAGPAAAAAALQTVVTLVSEVQHALPDIVDRRTLATLAAVWLSPAAFSPGAAFTMHIAPAPGIVGRPSAHAAAMASACAGNAGFGMDPAALFSSVPITITGDSGSAEFRTGSPDLPDVESYLAYIER